MEKILLLALLLSLSLVIASADDKDETAALNKEQTETKKEKPPRSTINTPDSFDPTETLSQDVPAAFPVDI